MTDVLHESLCPRSDVCVCVAATLQNLVLAADSLKSLQSGSSLEVLVTGEADGQPVSAKLVIELKQHQLIMMVHTHTHNPAVWTSEAKVFTSDPTSCHPVFFLFLFLLCRGGS